jgi:SRSO17 transposase
MSGAPVEEVLDPWSAELRAVKARLRALFARPSVATSAAASLAGLLGPERRETGRDARRGGRAMPGLGGSRPCSGAAAGRPTAPAIRCATHALEALAASDAVLVIDETGFLERGKASCGVGRQHTGSAGKVTSCQVGVFAAYVSGKGHAFVGRRPCLPEAWTDAPARLAAARVPSAVGFATRPRIAVHDRARDPGRRAVRVGGGRQRGARPRAGAAGPGGRGRGRDRLAPSRWASRPTAPSRPGASGPP